MDPSQMKTEAGREMAGRVNRSLETTETRLHRAQVVLKLYPLFTDNAQLSLAEVAIMWAISSLACNERREDCESLFYAYVDWMYADTPDAEKELSKSQREQASIAAGALIEHLSPNVGEIYQASARTLLQSNDELEKTLTRFLGTVLVRYMEHASSQDLSNVIVHCMLCCSAIENRLKGLADDRSQATMAELATACSVLIKSCQDAVENGTLSVENGEIVGSLRLPGE